MNATFRQYFNLQDSELGAGPAPALILKLSPRQGTISLQKNQYVRMENPVGWSVRAIDGSLWITQDGDTRDIVLEAGESFILDRDGPALLSAMGKAVISIDRACTGSTARRHASQRSCALAFAAA